MKIDGVAAVVTGGSSGLGAAVVETLARDGAKVSSFDLRPPANVTSSSPGAFFAVDVTDEAQVRTALDGAEAEHGPARILVNCAGIGPPAKVIDRDGKPLPLSKFAQIVSVNLFGTFNVLSQFAARLSRLPSEVEESAVIVNTASVAAYDGQIGQAAYSASKGAIVAMTLPLAREFARHHIRVMTIAPGLFETPLLQTLPQAARDSLAAQVPFPSRLGSPAEFAHLVRTVIENPMLNGEVIRLDGAIRMAAK